MGPLARTDGNTLMNMLQIIQAATGEMGLSVPTYVAGNPVQDVIQLLALLNACGGELQREYDWQRLVTEYRFTTQYTTLTGTTTTGSAIVTGLSSTTGLDTTYQVIGTGINTDTYILSVDSATQVTLTQNSTATGSASLSFCKTKYAFPDDYDRIIDRTEWDKTKHWEMLGPETAQEWQWLKSAYIATGPRARFRILDNLFQIWPPMASNEYLGWEYISEYWAINAAGTAIAQFSTDTDTCIFPDRLMIDFLKFQYWDVKGFDSSRFETRFNRQLAIAKANDAGSRTLSFAPQLAGVLITPQNIPDAGYGRS
jgi:hypothetical protein